MKLICTFSFLLLLSSFFSAVYAQIAKPLFDSTHYGFNTGSYPQGQSPSAVKTADIDNDGDSDL